MSKVSFLGAGSWGTALAIMLAEHGHQVTLWSKVEDEVLMLQNNREHMQRLPGIKLPESIVVTRELSLACSNQDLIVFSVASPFVRSVAKEAAGFISEGQKIVNVAKGIEEASLETLRDILTDEIPKADISVLSGPSHAEEVAMRMPTTVVVGSMEKETALFIQEIFMNEYFRVYISPDIIGIELGGSVKNVIALAAGACDGLGYGDNTKETLRDILTDEIPKADISVLSGPSHAEEVAMRMPTTVVVGSMEKETALFIQEIFMNEYFRVYISPDIIGIELGGSVKNVIALAAGACDGLGYGDNTKAALMTRGIAEITRLGLAMGAQIETLGGLSGIGDLIVTCTSKHSRNYNAGYLMGKGYSTKEAMAEVKQVVEGVYSAKAVYKLAQKHNISMPIVEQLCKVLFEDGKAEEVVRNLMTRDRRMEYPDMEWK
ncbi:MAG: NAD(P)-dependent glycerol-3-phosphate dehydrogenase [Clostridiaceae bacterium]|nr:NAD(P)-dependent glycerol-3-phosphate dehydrogenase [Clostridiaceae bacterium]